MSSQLEPAIWSCDTGQQIPCFDRCQLTITWMSNIKDVRCKLGDQLEYGRHVGLLLLLLLLLGYFSLFGDFVVRSHPQAILLAMITMRKAVHGFL